MFRALMIAALLAPAAPAFAQTVLETHEEVSMPAGKTVKLYRPIARDDCRATVRHHQSGKSMLHPATTADSARCAELAAKRGGTVASGN